MKNRNFVKKLNKNAESLAVVHTSSSIRHIQVFINHRKQKDTLPL